MMLLLLLLLLLPQCDNVAEMTFVDGTGQVHVVTRNSKEGRGLCSGIGLLGIITEVKLKLKVSLAL